MELGGNAPFLVFEDADLDAAVEGAMLAKMRNVGEACTAANRFHVHESVAEEFARRLAERMGALKVGRGTEPDVDVGPLIDEAQRAKVTELVGDAVDARRARAARRQPVVGARGYFFEPTVLDRRRRRRAAAARGDLRSGRPDRHVHLRGGGAGGGQPHASTGWSPTCTRATWSRALRVCEGIEAGMIGLNQGVVSNPAAPFGGVKQSGFGREGGFEGIGEYLETKYVAMGV